jgi:ubiquinone/menaquinone biosynthesis C-methylase UbiE
MSRVDPTRARLIEIYRHKARHYDLTARLSPVPGYPQHRLRLRAVQAVHLRPGDVVVDVACGTGLNFPLIQEAIGPDGRIVGVDITDAMLAQAQDRIEKHGWHNVSLVQSDAAMFEFPGRVDAIVSTYALTQVPDAAAVVRNAAAALSVGGRFVVLDLKAPAWPRWVMQLGAACVRPFAGIDDWMSRRPWETIRAAMQDNFADASWTEPCFGTAFVGVGSRGRCGPS